MLGRAVVGLRRLNLPRVLVASALLAAFAAIMFTSWSPEMYQSWSPQGSGASIAIIAWTLTLVVGGWVLGMAGGAVLGVLVTLVMVPIASSTGFDGIQLITGAQGVMVFSFDIVLGALPGALADSYHESRARARELARKNEELERATVALRQSETLFRQFAERVDEGVWIAPLGEGAHLYVNPALLRIYGVERFPDWELFMRESIHPDDAARVRASSKELETGLAQDIEYRARSPTGQWRWVNARSFPVFGPDDTVSSYVGVVNDITERKERESRRELLERRERLGALGTLVAGVAHEINNPLTYIMGNLQLVEEELAGVEVKSPASRERIERISRMLGTSIEGGQRIASIVKALRAVTRQSGGTREPVRLNSVATNVHELIRTSVPPTLKLRLSLSPNDPVVTGNPGELYQVLLNLATNAVQAIGTQPGAITIETRETEDGATISVRDDGPGMTPEQRAKLFTPFFTTKPEGTGLGLSLAHAIVHAHGGEIEVESAPGAGSRFRVRLPLAAPMVVRA